MQAALAERLAAAQIEEDTVQVLASVVEAELALLEMEQERVWMQSCSVRTLGSV